MNSKTEQFEKLKTLGFDTPINKKCNTNQEIEEVFNFFLSERTNLDYDIDGLVISIDDLDELNSLGYVSGDKQCPKGQIALKFPSIGSIVTIKEIEWSSEGAYHLAPVAIFDPVECGGAVIKRAHLKSLQWMRENNCGVGTIVELIRSGDVIPKITKVISNLVYEITIPNVCPVCNSLLIEDGAFLLCSNEMCIAKEAARINKFLSILKIKGLGFKTLLQYVQSGVRLIDFFNDDSEFSIIENKIKTNSENSLVIWEKIKQSLIKRQQELNS